MDEWYLSAAERDNPASTVDSRHPDGAAWTTGNEVRPLIHGAAYFAELFQRIQRTGPGDLILFTDWRGDPDERLDGEGTEIGRLLCEAARRGVVVKGLVWRSHLDRLQFSERENRHLGDEIEAAGGECLLDMRVRMGGSHHQKMVVLRHPGRPEWDVAYVGGIDLCHSRRDTKAHRGDPQPQPMSGAYGRTPPWHDIQLAISGPAVGDVEATFRERWCDRTPLSRNPLHRVRDWLSHADTRANPLPEQLPDPPPRGEQPVQLLRTYPYRRRGYPFAPDGERSVARGYIKALGRARRLIYLEDQYLWSTEVARVFAEALRARPDLYLVGVLPMHPDSDGLTGAAQVLGRARALSVLRKAGGDRVAVYGVENEAGTPVYIHAKACVIDDEWAAVGSDNLNRRSWTYDSELCCAVCDPGYARDLRLRLMSEHLGLHPAGRNDPVGRGDAAGLNDPAEAVSAFERCAAAQEAWYAGGAQGERPPGRLRLYRQAPPTGATRWGAAALYEFICDPDGRPARLRRRHAF